MKLFRSTAATALGALLLSHLSSSAVAQSNDEMGDWERCYGVALAGENDGMASGPNELVPGTSEEDFAGEAWVLTPKGECEAIVTPSGHGSLVPFDD